ncbi:DUF6507 family protein [Microbacterium sp. NPDC057407]|uniref:DUF6507 family protein n=1 Tax=Microbacterium sp. NPDC057407 TaxID=3346120 RepID=UPI00367346E0
MDGWRVDPDRVVGILAGIDDAGSVLTRAAKDVDALYPAPVSLALDERTSVATAWTDFFEDRRAVPGKLIHVLSSSATALSEATVAVIAGDERMAADAAVAERQAFDRWGLDSSVAYGNGMFGWG